MITVRGRAFYLEAAKLLDRNSPNYGAMVRVYLRNYQREFKRSL